MKERETESSHVECAYEGSGRKKLREGGVGGCCLRSVPFDPPAHHFEETAGMNGINGFDKTQNCPKIQDISELWPDRV